MHYSNSIEGATVVQHGKFCFHRNTLNMIADKEWVPSNYR